MGLDITPGVIKYLKWFHKCRQGVQKEGAIDDDSLQILSTFFLSVYVFMHL